MPVIRKGPADRRERFLYIVAELSCGSKGVHSRKILAFQNMRQSHGPYMAVGG